MALVRLSIISEGNPGLILDLEEILSFLEGGGEGGVIRPFLQWDRENGRKLWRNLGGVLKWGVLLGTMDWDKRKT